MDEEHVSKISRRNFLAGVAGVAAASFLGIEARDVLRPVRARAHESCAAADPSLRHLAWVWQFNQDGEPEAVAENLAIHDMGVTVKTHDGIDWMSTYDVSSNAITGTYQVERVARTFEDAGVPFHAWALVKGEDPRAEAQLAASVLDAGARSLTLDLEAGYGFYVGNADTAAEFGYEFRRLKPDSQVYLSIDPRPWRAAMVPLAEFASFSNGWMPQVYWESFNSPANLEEYARAGRPTDAITPEFLLDSSYELLAPYGQPIYPVGQGASMDTSLWQRFVDHSITGGMNLMSVWRYGVANPDVWPLLKGAVPVHDAYVVQPGDTVSGLAERWSVSQEKIVALNAISDPSLIQIGQTLCRP
jgi:LysM domain